MNRRVRWLVLGSLSFLVALFLFRASPPRTAPPSADERTFEECNDDWFHSIRQSEQYSQFLARHLDTNGVPELELSKLALVAAFSSEENLGQAFEVILKYSNKYTAATLCACLEGYMGHPGQAYYHLDRFADAHPPCSARDLEAALFAHIQDKPSVVKHSGAYEVFPILRREWREDNMYSAFAVKLAARNQSYMYNEWRRLSKFTQNKPAAKAARRALRSMSPSPEAEEFTRLVGAIRSLYRRACCKRIVAYQRTTAALPGPYEAYSIRLADVTGGQVLVTILDQDGNIYWEQNMKYPDTVALPTIMEGQYRMTLDRLVNYPIGIDYGVFSVRPSFFSDVLP